MSLATFSAREAMQLLGKEVRSGHACSGLPEGTPGRIVEVRRDVDIGGFHVSVLWELPTQPKKEQFSKAEFQRLLAECLDQ